MQKDKICKHETKDKQINPQGSDTISTNNRRIIIKKQNLIRKWTTDLQETYTIDKKLGEGSFGEVFLVIHKKLQIKRALKIIQKSVRPTSNSYDQLQILKRLDHPNILKIYEYFQSQTKWYIITQYFEGKQLFQQIIQQKYLNEKVTVAIVHEILKALLYIHTNKIAHRDIKAENILVRKQNDNYIVKIIDWGLGALVFNNSLNRKCGTPQYCAPEVLKGSYSINCDLWSLGVLVYIMLSGYMPFKGHGAKQTLNLVQKAQLNFKNEIWLSISFEAKQFIKGLLQKDPIKRLTAQSALSHSWIIINIQKHSSQADIELTQTLVRIKQFQYASKFQMVVINFILNFIHNQQQNQRLKRQFQLIDTNGDGSLSFNQLLEAYRKIYGPEAEEIVQKIFISMDLDGSGSITFSQFITFAAPLQQKFSQDQLKQAFQLFDSDNDGMIDKTEINHLITFELGSKSVSSQFEEIISQIDLNNDGKIDINQFIQHINAAVQRVASRTQSSIKAKNLSKSSQKQSLGDIQNKKEENI